MVRRNRRRRSHRRRRKCRGGTSVLTAIPNAVLPVLGRSPVPLSLYALQKLKQRRRKRGGRTKHKRRGKRYRKGSRSKTRRGRLDFITHLGSNVFDRMGHFLRLNRRPYTKRKGRKARKARKRRTRRRRRRRR